MPAAETRPRAPGRQPSSSRTRTSSCAPAPGAAIRWRMSIDRGASVPSCGAARTGSRCATIGGARGLGQPRAARAHADAGRRARALRGPSAGVAARAPLGNEHRLRRFRRRQHRSPCSGSYALTNRLVVRADVTHLLGRLSPTAGSATAASHTIFMPAMARLAASSASAAASSHVSSKADAGRRPRTAPTQPRYAGLGLRGYLTDRFLFRRSTASYSRVHEPGRKRGSDAWTVSVHVFLLTALARSQRLPARRQRSSNRCLGQCRVADNPQVVDPRVERRDIKPRRDRHRELRGRRLYVGTISIEDFGSNVVYRRAPRLSLHRGSVRRSQLGPSEAGKTSYEDLSGAAELLTDSERQFTYYDLSLG